MRANLISFLLVILAIPIISFGAKAPDFTVTDYGNKVHKLYEDYLNKDKVMVIKFFFIGCPPCATIAPLVQSSYTRWGSGLGKVQFLEISTMKGDYNSNIKSYSQNKGLTFPGVGFDGGAQAVLQPYSSGTFGPWYGTPTFVVIAPNGDVNYNVNMSLGNPSGLDTAIAQALRLGSGGGGGGGGCSYAFSVKTITKLVPETYYVVDLLNGYPAHEVRTGNYNCEFALPPNIDGHYVIPQMNQTDDPINGVSTADIVQIQRYILFLQPFNNLQRAVADVNNSSTITAADVSELRKLILGITSGFSKLTKTYTVVHNPKSLNPIDLTDKVLVKDLVSKAKTNEFGIGKYGDVTGANLFAGNEVISRSSMDLKLIVEVERNSDGNYVHRFFSDQAYNLTSFQYELQGKANNIMGIAPNVKFSATGNFDYNINIGPGAIRMIGLTDNEAIHLDAGEIWFSVITRTNDKLKNSYIKGFEHEFLFDQLSTVVSSVDINYLTATSSQDDVNISYQSDGKFKIITPYHFITKLDIMNVNGVQVSKSIYSEPSNQVIVSSSSLRPGIYFAKVLLSNGKTVLKKFISF